MWDFIVNTISPTIRVDLVEKDSELYPILSLFLVEVAGKRGHKQLITVLGDAPDENKEPEEAETCGDDERRLYFEPSENPRVRVPLPHSTPKKEKKTVLDGLGRSGG